MNFAENFKRRLSIPRDIEGNPNREVFRAVNVVHESLVDEPEFICVDPFGSSMKGYSDSGSDIDICIYLDFKITGHEDFISRASEIYSRTRELKGMAMASLSENEISEENIHLVSFYVDEQENIQRIKAGFTSHETDAFVVASLFRKVSGTRIKSYRNSVIREILLLPHETQKILINKMATALVQKEQLSFYKVKRRLEEKQEEVDFEDLVTQRTALWVARINKFLIEAQ